MTELTKHDRIFLQVCDDEASEWCGEVTWCEDRIHDTDVEYIRKELHDQQLDNATKQNVMLRDALDRLLQTHVEEAIASMAFCNAEENFTDSSVEKKAYEKAIVDARAAESSARKALAATADLSGLVLCHAEPMAHFVYIAEQQTGYVVEDLEDAMDDLTNTNATTEPLFRRKQP